MKISNIEISDEWVLTHPSSQEVIMDFTAPIGCRTYQDTWYKICYNSRTERYSSLNIVGGESYYKINFVGFPGAEYNLMFGEGSMREFNSLQDAKNHLDNFLIKLNNLKVFL